MMDVAGEVKNKNEKLEKVEKDNKIYKNFVDYCNDYNLDLAEETQKELKKIINLNTNIDYKVHMIMELIFETKYEW